VYLEKKPRQDEKPSQGEQRQDKGLGFAWAALASFLTAPLDMLSSWFGTNQQKRAAEQLQRDQWAHGFAPFSPIPGTGTESTGPGPALNLVPILIIGGVALGAFMIMRGGKQQQPIVLMGGR
jgi:hypothetical protein